MRAAAITTDGTYTLALKSRSTNSVIYTSKEGGSPPRLLFTTGRPGLATRPGGAT